MVQDDITQDGAEERMLNNENDDAEKLTGKKEEIKFIPADKKNGDAKIDIEVADKKVGFLSYLAKNVLVLNLLIENNFKDISN